MPVPEIENVIYFSTLLLKCQFHSLPFSGFLMKHSAVPSHRQFLVALRFPFCLTGIF